MKALLGVRSDIVLVRGIQWHPLIESQHWNPWVCYCSIRLYYMTFFDRKAVADHGW